MVTLDVAYGQRECNPRVCEGDLFLTWLLPMPAE